MEKEIREKLLNQVSEIELELDKYSCGTHTRLRKKIRLLKESLSTTKK